MSYQDIRSTFKLIRGGLSETACDSPKEFVSASITDTRLMGVVGMCVHWKLTENSGLTDLHQFFYFDAEETGFETYKSVLGNGSPEDAKEISDIENYMLGGLGGKKVSLTEKEARFMLQSYVDLNIRSNLPLPEDKDEYNFMLTPRVILTDAEEYVLMCKQCPVLDSPYQVINYFLMRCIGKDFGAAKFLTKGYVRTNLFPKHKGATLLRNVIEESPDTVSGYNTDYHVTDDDKDFATFDTFKSYLCDSLIEYDGKYFLLITQISLDRLKVVKYEKVSEFQVTPAEASMMTTKAEFITVTDLVPGAPKFDRSSTQLASKAMITDYENGRLFMIFQPHNDHVKKQTYLLNDDVLGVYYILEDNQLILSSYNLPDIRRMEIDLASSPMAPYIVPVSKYEFKDPVLFDFINSSFDDFEDFVAAIAKPPTKHT
ncbi:MAG: hypothetical protein DBY08_06055 [Clostridiales bacterium]|nr:MAG: hypothetical protein DBY08_06055 [Clostridiales bacterium]